MNDICIVTFVNHLHVSVTKSKSSFMFFNLSVLTSNKVIWVNLSAILFDETQLILKTSTTDYMPVCYEIINLFIKSQNFLLMGFIYKLKGLYLIITTCDGLLIFFLDLFDSCIKSAWCDILQDVFVKHLALFFSRVYSDIKSTSQQNENIMILSIFPRGSHLISSSDNLAANAMIWAIPRYCPICALINQFCSVLSTNTSISLRLTSSGLLQKASLNKEEDIFIKFRATAR